jgi:Cu+-exporting ATPase
MTQTKESNQFILTDETERQLSLIVSSIYHDKERSSILQTLLLKRIAIKMVLIDREENSINIFFDPDKLAKKNLLSILEKILKHFSEKPHQITKKKTNSVKQSASKNNLSFKVGGMSCESCALFLEMVLSREQDIMQADIDFKTQTGVVLSYLSTGKIFDIILQNGYQAYNIETLKNDGE